MKYNFSLGTFEEKFFKVLTMGSKDKAMEKLECCYTVGESKLVKPL